MKTTDFVHLHVHSEYSLLDGSVKIKDLTKALKDKGFNSAALTDHDALHGIVEYYLACQSSGLHSIIGYEANISFLSSSHEGKIGHLILLAKDLPGYKNLLKLSSLANTVGKDEYCAKITWADLKEHGEGLICLTSCIKGELATLILEDKEPSATHFIKTLESIFQKEDIYVELIDNGLEEQKRLIPKLVNFAKSHALKIVATQDVHYIQKSEKKSHLSVLAIKHKLKKSEVNQIPDEIHFHLASKEEMNEKFKDYPEALKNTVEISRKCQLKLDLSFVSMPNYSEKEDESPEDCLTRLAKSGLENRKPAIKAWLKEKFSEEVWREYNERLEFELNVIKNMKFSGYFLIVQDFINWAMQNNIPVGPGRGSAAGSLVTYCLYITNIDPIRFNLLFERFLNPERISMPDIDTDFCQDRREDVIKYVYSKYGERCVCQIVTFGRMMARNAIKNLARILRWSFKDSNDFVKLIPETLGITLDQAEDNLEIKERLKKDERARELWKGSKDIEATLISLGIHAAGVIISDRPIDELCPVIESEGQLLTQFEHKYAEKVGLIKFDFLGLKTLTVIHKALGNISKIHGHKIDIDNINLEDSKIYDLLSNANVTGVFQLESPGMRKLLSQLKPTCFNDIIAVLALFRPGPLGSGMVEDFVLRKHGQKQVEYLFDELEPILEDTYGVIVYQEQVQKIAAVMANYSLGEADLLRRAMGKKDKAVMEEQKNRFVNGAQENGHNPDKALELFELMAMFAEYGFNKSHTTAYGLLTYQTAWLKAHYPTEFMATIMSSDLDNTDKVVSYIKDCRRIGIEVLMPNLNLSDYEFKVIKSNQISFGLGAIKGLGKNISEEIVREREKSGFFKTVPEFIARIEAKKLNKKSMESLINSGSFDSIATQRRELFKNCENWIRTIAQEQEKSQSTDMGIFSVSESSESGKTTQNSVFIQSSIKQSLTQYYLSQYYNPYLRESIVFTNDMPNNIKNFLLGIQKTEFTPYSFKETLENERKLLGASLSSHPVFFYSSDLSYFRTPKLQSLQSQIEPPSVLDYKRKIHQVIGVVTQKIEKRTKDGDKLLIFSLEDETGEIELVLYPNQYSILQFEIEIGIGLFIECKLKEGFEKGTIKGLIQKIEPLERKRIESIQGVNLSTSSWILDDKNALVELCKVFDNFKGKSKVFLTVNCPKEELQIKAVLKNCFISPFDNFFTDLEEKWPGRFQFEVI